MIIIHGANNLPRWVRAALAARLKVMPAVILTGARQTGKRTLAEHLVDAHRRFASLDDLDILDLARRDPQALLGGERPMTLDEVQREPMCCARSNDRSTAIAPRADSCSPDRQTCCSCGASRSHWRAVQAT